MWAAPVAMAAAGVLCWVAVAVAMSAAGRASGRASNAAAAERGAIAARDDADSAARVARVVTGIDFSFDGAHAAETDVSHRIWQDLRTAGATAQRINARAGSPRRASQQPLDVWVKPPGDTWRHIGTAAASRLHRPHPMTAERRRALTHRRRPRGPQEVHMPIVAEPAAPPPTHTLTYRADVRHMVGEVVGPSVDGRTFRAVDAELLDDGSTRVTFQTGTRPAPADDEAAA